jgi:hypothetical protein
MRSASARASSRIRAVSVSTPASLVRLRSSWAWASSWSLSARSMPDSIFVVVSSKDETNDGQRYLPTR